MRGENIERGGRGREEREEEEKRKTSVSEEPFVYAKRIGPYKYFSLQSDDNENPTLCLLNNSNLKQAKRKEWKKKRKKLRFPDIYRTDN